MTTKWIWRVDITIRDSSGVTSVKRYATKAYNVKPTHPTLSAQHVEGRLIKPLLFTRHMFAEGQAYGEVSIAHGECVLQNADGGLDFLVNYALDAQLYELYRVDPDNTDTEVLCERLNMESARLDRRHVTLLLRDGTYLFDRPLQPTKYAGNNVLPNGLEGGEELKGKPKPICYGKNENETTYLVNSSRYIHQWGDEAFNTGWSLVLRDAGVQLTQGVSRSLAQFNAGVTTVDFTVNTATDVCTTTAAHGYSTGACLTFKTSGTLPAPLSRPTSLCIRQRPTRPTTPTRWISRQRAPARTTCRTTGRQRAAGIGATTPRASTPGSG
jgi:hypothetical protein